MKKTLNMYFATHKTCNLNCMYCYIPKYNRKKKKEDDENILNEAKRFIAKVENEGYRIGNFCFHGSEPSLTSPGTLVDVIKLLERHWRSNNCSNHKVAIQTNGVLIDNEYLDVVESETGTGNLKIGFSIDPPKAVHDKYRNCSFDKVEKNYLNAINRGFKTSVLSVVTLETINHTDDFIRWMNEQLERRDRNKNPYKVKIKLASGDLAMTEDEIERFTDLLIENELTGLIQILTPGYCIVNGNECEWYEFDIQGNCYSCNKMYFDEGIFANWHEETIDEIVAKRKKIYTEFPEHEECSTCQYEYLCNSGCPVDRYKTGNMAGKAHECTLIKKVYKDLEQKGIHITDFYNNNS